MRSRVASICVRCPHGLPRVEELAHFFFGDHHCHVPQLPDAACFERSRVVAVYCCLVDCVRLNLGHDVELKMFKAKGAIMVVRAANLLVDVYEYDEVRHELVAFEIDFTFALGQIDLVFRRSVASLYLNQFLDLRIRCVDDEIATCKVGAETTSVVRGDAMHPALCGDSSLSDAAMRLLLAKTDGDVFHSSVAKVVSVLPNGVKIGSGYGTNFFSPSLPSLRTAGRKILGFVFTNSPSNSSVKFGSILRRMRS